MSTNAGTSTYSANRCCVYNEKERQKRRREDSEGELIIYTEVIKVRVLLMMSDSIRERMTAMVKGLLYMSK